MKAFCTQDDCVDYVEYNPEYAPQVVKLVCVGCEHRVKHDNYRPVKKKSRKVKKSKWIILWNIQEEDLFDSKDDALGVMTTEERRKTIIAKVEYDDDN